jgi:hypothetical protein
MDRYSAAESRTLMPMCGRRLATHGGSSGVESCALEALDRDGVGDDLDHAFLDQNGVMR